MSNSPPLECFHFHCKLHWDLSDSECVCACVCEYVCTWCVPVGYKAALWLSTPPASLISSCEGRVPSADARMCVCSGTRSQMRLEGSQIAKLRLYVCVFFFFFTPLRSHNSRRGCCSERHNIRRFECVRVNKSEWVKERVRRGGGNREVSP